MKTGTLYRTMIPLILVSLLAAPLAFSQGYDDPLTIQGIDHNTLQSAASRALGGTTIGVQNDVGVMFMNPASLRTLKGFQISVGGVQQFEKAWQAQQYAPLKYYSNFSLLMEGLTGLISDPTGTITGTANAGDTVQRPFDNIGPNWTHSKNRGVPLQILVGMPFSLGKYKFAVGLGAVQYADLSQHYENHNVLSPAIGSERPVPVELPPSDSTPVQSNWSAYYRTRDGMIRGYGLSLAGSVSEAVSFGASGMYLSGGTNDYEQEIGRGTLMFYRNNYFRLTPLDNAVTQSGTSDYSGVEFTVSGIYRGKFLSIGISVKPPAVITRKYTRIVATINGGASSSTTVTGQDKLKLPWRGTAGISLAVRDNLMLALEYELRPFASAVYWPAQIAGGGRENPWLSSSALHLGAEFDPLPWLAVRLGVRGQSEVFQETGSPIIDEAVTSSVYSGGVGITYGAAHFNVTYEYAPMKYADMWQTNVNLNRDKRHTFVADISYDLPWAK